MGRQKMGHLERSVMRIKNVFWMNRPLTGIWGQIMDSRIFGIRASLCLMLVFSPLAAWADTEVTSASHSTRANGDVIITLSTSVVTFLPAHGSFSPVCPAINEGDEASAGY